MPLDDLLVPGSVLPSLRVNGKKQAVQELSARAASVTGLPERDVFDAVLTPGDLLLLMSWRDQDSAEGYERSTVLPDGARFRRVRVVRDYGMFDRRESPQYYPDVKRSDTEVR